MAYQPDLLDPVDAELGRLATAAERIAERARQAADSGIDAAAQHAGPEWLDRAAGYTRLYALLHPFFLIEEARAMAEADGLAPPPDKRSWGKIPRILTRDKTIERAGYAPANSSNRSPKVLWRSLIFATPL